MFQTINKNYVMHQSERKPPIKYLFLILKVVL